MPTLGQVWISTVRQDGGIDSRGLDVVPMWLPSMSQHLGVGDIGALEIAFNHDEHGAGIESDPVLLVVWSCDSPEVRRRLKPPSRTFG